jgi:uncharacterized repeat protein (TIGR01451 family)
VNNVPKKLLPVFLALLMVFGAVGLGVAAADNNNEPNNPMNAVFTKTESVSTLEIGDVVTFSVTVSNPNSDNGHNDFTNVKISDTVPNGVKVIGVTGGSFSGNDVSADIGTLKPGESKTITIITQAVKTGKFINTANLVYTVDEGQMKLVCGKEEHTHDANCYSMVVTHACNHQCTHHSGCIKDVQVPHVHVAATGTPTGWGQHSGCYVSDFHFGKWVWKLNCHKCFDTQEVTNCVHVHDKCCGYKEECQLTCCKEEHTHSCECYGWCPNLIQREAQAPSDPTIVEPSNPPIVNPSNPTIKAAGEPTANAPKETVGMQETGAPIAALLLAGLMLFTGMLLPKRK